MSRSVRDPGHLEGPSVLVECDPTELSAGDRVRDVDQLSEENCRAFLTAIDGSTWAVGSSDLATGDVIKYTAYYRVE
ncbi:hypothetical protein [Halobellus salinisoli]|uniref:hypothetical protein n=1 Tax=Halobellus salinisoli TaxID=3108500 RepID=UPI00300834A9